MERILSTGITMTIATTTSDAGQLGTAAEFAGDRIRLLIYPLLALATGRRIWGAVQRWLGQRLAFRCGVLTGDRHGEQYLRERDWHRFSQHFVHQH